jgi:hypothetical protein
MPPDLALQAAFGLTLRCDAAPAAQGLRDFLRSAGGQEILVKNGFTRA